MELPEWAFVAALIAMFVGIIGVILPVVPGVGFIWIVVLIYAIAEKFATIDLITFTVLTILGVIGFTADLWMTQVGAKAGGASPFSLLVGFLLGTVGALVGAIFLGVGAIPGAIVGAIAGVVIAEYHRREDWNEAFKAGGGWAAGCLLSGGVQFLIAILMILIFVWQVLRG
ncbi:MAG: hypothetical protein B6I35_12000 [Anaerolineaceae bacterium 4572_32.2]|nr:MAG: hypothetical protein B6I35_12000 [Anaerolineaceae bacterium 4572_32.2]